MSLPFFKVVSTKLLDLSFKAACHKEHDDDDDDEHLRHGFMAFGKLTVALKQPQRIDPSTNEHCRSKLLGNRCLSQCGLIWLPENL